MTRQQLETLRAAGLVTCLRERSTERVYRIARGAEPLFRSTEPESIQELLARVAPQRIDRRPSWAWTEQHEGREINYPRLELKKCGP